MTKKTRLFWKRERLETRELVQGRERKEKYPLHCHHHHLSPHSHPLFSIIIERLKLTYHCIKEQGTWYTYMYVMYMSIHAFIYLLIQEYMPLLLSVNYTHIILFGNDVNTCTRNITAFQRVQVNMYMYMYM